MNGVVYSRTVAAGLILAAVMTFMAAWGAPVSDLAGHWEGAVELPGLKLAVLVDLIEKNGAWSGTIDVPMQGAGGLPLEAVTVAGDSLSFIISGIPGTPSFRGTWADGTIAGIFSQSGHSAPFTLGREKVALPARPQTPRPPFPYREEQVTYASGAITLAGTLTIPRGAGPFPAALLITGSGAQNRDEEIFGHKPFALLADHLTRAGLVVLRVDDRGVGGSTGKNRNATTSDFADDALAGVRFLRARPEIDSSRVGVIGHSEGAIVGPLAASRAPDEVAFVVMMAGTGVPLDEVIERQTVLNGRASGTPEAAIEVELAKSRLVMSRVKSGADSVAIREQLLALLAEQARSAAAGAADSAADAGDNPAVDAGADAERAPAGDPAAEADGMLRAMLSPWFRFAVGYDPRPALRGVRCPVLVLTGELDKQVDPDQNLPEIEEALREGGNRDVTVMRLPGLNHLFQKAKTGSENEYGAIEETINPAALEAISGWLAERW